MMWVLKKSAMIFILYVSIIGTANSNEDVKPPIIYYPIIKTSVGTVAAGTAFIVKNGKMQYAVTAQHLIGTAGGLKKDYNGHDLLEIFKNISLTPVFSGYENIESKDFIKIPNAEGINETTAKNDIFISPLSGTIDSTPFRIAAREPDIGDTVMLYAAVSSSDKFMHKAIVAELSEDQIIYIFEDKDLNLRATSGAPILNQQNQVIGINLAGGKLEDGSVVGFANPSKSILYNINR